MSRLTTRRTVPIATVLALLAAQAPAQQQDQPPMTAEQIEAARRALEAQDRARVREPEDVEALRALQLDQLQAERATGYSNLSRRRPMSREVDIVSDGAGTPYQAQPVELYEGLVTSASFFTFNGEPWPVEAVSYDRSRVAVQGEGCDQVAGDAARLEGLGNIITLLPCEYFTTTSAQVLLQGETTPILLDLSSGTRDENPIVDGAVTFNVRSEARPPFGRDRTGRLNNDQVTPLSRALVINPIDASQGGVNAITLSTGVITDVSFLDRVNTPWPIDQVVYPSGVVAVNGTCAELDGGMTTLDLEGETSTMYVTACLDTRATIGVKLSDKPAALSLLTVPARPPATQPDGTLSVTVPGVSPVTPEMTVASASAPGAPVLPSGYGAGFTPDRFLDDFLLGSPPQGSRRANITGGGDLVEGWYFNGALYLRGYFQVVNPANDAQAQTPDGSVFVWKYGPPVSRVLAVDLSGREFAFSIY